MTKQERFARFAEAVSTAHARAKVAARTARGRLAQPKPYDIALILWNTLKAEGSGVKVPSRT